MDVTLPLGACDADKQTILHLSARSGSAAATRTAALACAPLRTRSVGVDVQAELVSFDPSSLFERRLVSTRQKVR